ncbi:MAG: redox-regulated ATPase YchF [Nitrospirota bacterium]
MVRVAITGLSNSGKTTVFNALTRQNIETTIYPTIESRPNIGIVKVPDARLDRLSEILKPEKTTYATIEFIDYIGLTKGDIEQNRRVFDLIKDVDAMTQVVRAFGDSSIVHPMGPVDPIRDIETVELELIFGDLDLIEKRLDRMKDLLKRGKKPDELEKKVLLKCKDFLNKEVPLREANLDEEEQKALRHLQFLSIKPETVVLNIGENDLKTDRLKELKSAISERLTTLPLLIMCAKIEMELAQLPSEEARLFFDDLGIDEPASEKLIRACYSLLGLVTFFSTAGREVRAWSIKKGTLAQKAAGKVHTDIERGFIRAEVISFDDFISAGSMHVAKDKGLLRLEGKSYEIKDGDIVNFRFNV